MASVTHRCAWLFSGAASSRAYTAATCGRSRADVDAVLRQPRARRRPTTTAGDSAARGSYGDYDAAIDDPAIDAVVIAVPPRFHLDLTLRALAAGKHVLVEKPAFLTMADYETVRTARDRAGRVVLVGENDHYKPLAVRLRALLADGVIGEMVFAHFMTLAQTAEDGRRLAQRRNDGRRRRVLRGRHPLAAPGRQPRPADHRHPAATGRRCRGPGRTRVRKA